MKIDCSKSQLKKVGEKLRHGAMLLPEEEVWLATFRIGHRSIIEAFRNHHKQILGKSRWQDRRILFASRLKKRQTLIDKLSARQQKMDLTRMHDIAGCRLIFQNLSDLWLYRDSFSARLKKQSHFSLLSDESQYNYIQHPRVTGYRSIHDVYQEVCADSIKAKIEVQYRTAVQHSWATALEIWDQSHFKGAKFGLEDANIQKLFALYSELLWRIYDFNDSNNIKRNVLDISDAKLYREITEMEHEFGVLKFLANIPRAQVKMSVTTDEVLLRRIASQDDALDNSYRLEAKQISWDFIQGELFDNEIYGQEDLVFVQTDPKILKQTYNNYFDDPRKFVKRVRMAMKRLYEGKSFFSPRSPLDTIFVSNIS